jgi:hypothetical protein
MAEQGLLSGQVLAGDQTPPGTLFQSAQVP